jgi:predicted ATP-dependent protease
LEIPTDHPATSAAPSAAQPLVATLVPAPLAPAALSRRCDPAAFDFETTAEIESLTEIVGQPRAVAAMRFGVGIAREGFNIFALGQSGVGRHVLVRRFLEAEAAQRPVPDDICYVHNFDQPHKPRVLRLPAGTGVRLRDDMAALIEDLRASLPAAFESEEYQTRRHVVEEHIKEQGEQAFGDLGKRARERGFAMLRTPGGLVFAPLKPEGDEIIEPDAFQKLPEEERDRIQAEIETLQSDLQKILRQIPRMERELREQIRTLDREVTDQAVGHLIDDLRQKYAELEAVTGYLDAVEADVIARAGDFLDREGGPQAALAAETTPADGPLRRYRVNVLIDHSASEHAPLVYEDNPNFINLIGRVEYIAQMGALVTDFNLIRPGALHQANGGYLLLDARKVLVEPYAWEALKRALQSRQLRIESLGQALGMVSTVSLEPEPVALDVKVALVGEPMLYYLLCSLDPDFAPLFKVAADLDDRMEWDVEGQAVYARLIATLARRQNLRALDRSAVARVIEHGARMTEDRERLSMSQESLENLICEADWQAEQAASDVIRGQDVEAAIEAQIYRSDRLRTRVHEGILRDTIMIDTAGAVIGQVNGLSVIQLGGFGFGQPSRITARVRLGKGEVVDIEREVDLGGPLHSKGVLILTGFLGERYASMRPLALSASLVFEQSYGGVDGDSASSAELYALLSALAEAPVRQGLAVTGSVNQHGQVQPIGGVNEKIEGFFDICRARGLTGDQGVMIPSTNVKHLMLRRDVVDAVAAGRFQVYPIETIDQGIALLSGVEAGERGPDGSYPPASINGRVAARLAAMADAARAFQTPQLRGAEPVAGDEQGAGGGT